MIIPINSSKDPLSECTANAITEFIIESGLKAGDKLPCEIELGQQFCVGRGTVREAIKILVSRNIVSITRGVGTFVAERTGVSDDPFGFKFMNDKDKLVLDLLQLRSFIEPSLAGLTAINISANDLLKLEEIEKHFENTKSNFEELINHDEKFHTTIATCSNNHLVNLIIPVLLSKMPEIKATDRNSFLKSSAEGHKQILNAIKERDSEKASKAMFNHIIHMNYYFSKL